LKRATLILFSIFLISIGGGNVLANFQAPQTPVQKIKLVPKENRQDHVDISFKITAEGKVEVVYIEGRSGLH
jgi:hypothetical protein